MSLAYTRAASAAEASQLAAAEADARFLAGGQSLLPAMRLGLSAPTRLIDLQGLGLDRIERQGDAFVIGAGCRHAQVAAHAEVGQLLPGLAALAGQIGDRQVRQMGTLGGSIANADPAACYPAALVGLGATVHTNRRTIAADSFFTGLYSTALQAGELIEKVSFPLAAKSAWQKFKQPASRFSLVGVFVSQGAGGVRVAVTGAAASVFRATAIEQALSASFMPAAARAVKIDAGPLLSDLHGSAAYRAALIPELAARAVAALA